MLQLWRSVSQGKIGAIAGTHHSHCSHRWSHCWSCSTGPLRSSRSLQTCSIMVLVSPQTLPVTGKHAASTRMGSTRERWVAERFFLPRNSEHGGIIVLLPELSLSSSSKLEARSLRLSTKDQRNVHCRQRPYVSDGL